MSPNLLSPPKRSQIETLKGLIRRTIRTYSLPWIVVNEAIQNALDAIQKGRVSEGEVLVEFNMDSDQVSVRDNGRGFPYDPDLDLFFWGGTDKEFDPARHRLLGYQGVGLKVILYSSNNFKVDTVCKKRKWALNIRDAYLYESKNKIIPDVRKPVDTRENSGSTVSYSFPDGKVCQFFNKIFEQYNGKIGSNLANSNVEKFLIGLEHYFRTYTYAGNIDRVLNLPDAPKKSLITMKIYWSQIPSDFPEELQEIFRSATSPLVLSFENKHWDVKEILDRVKPRYRGRRPSPITFAIPSSGYSGRHGPSYIYVNKFTARSDFQSLITNMRARKPADMPYYQRYLFPRVRGIYLVVGAREVLSDYLFADVERQQFICAQTGVPTEHKIKEPADGGELGYLPNIYLAISTNADLSYGKRQITDPWLLGYVNKYFTDAFRLTLRDIARAFVGKMRPPSPPPSMPTKIVGLPDITTVPAIAKTPEDENMLIAIFYVLIGSGHIRGLKTYYLSSQAPYDGKVVIRAGNTFPSPTTDSHLQTMEFKISLRELIDQLDRGYKNPDNINLIVVWEDDYSTLPITKQLPDFGVEDNQSDDLPEASKKLVCRHIPREIPIIAVRDTLVQKFGQV